MIQGLIIAMERNLCIWMKSYYQFYLGLMQIITFLDSCQVFFISSEIGCCFELNNQVISVVNQGSSAVKTVDWSTENTLEHKKYNFIEIKLPKESGCYDVSIELDNSFLLKNRDSLKNILIKRKILIVNGVKYKRCRKRNRFNIE